jgi:phospholipid transport system substrate-binding protein
MRWLFLVGYFVCEASSKTNETNTRGKIMMSLLTRLLCALILALTWHGAAKSEIKQDAPVTQLNPYQVLLLATDRTFNSIKTQQDSIASDPKLLRNIMNKELMPYVDYEFSAFKVLGKHFRGMQKAELSAFAELFREYLIATYATTLSVYNNQTLELEPSRNIEDKTDVTIKGLIKDSGRPDINIAFKLRKNSRTQAWLIYDMIAEGISLLSSKQSEFGPMLRTEGVPYVMTKMKEVIAASDIPAAKRQ